VLQEGLTNTVKHSRAQSVEVGVHVGDGEVEVTVADDGRSSAASAPSHRVPGAGSGLRGLRERVGLFGGRLAAASTDDGWVLRAVIPTGRS
jgi:signal transduction histidine kinase